MDKPSVFNPSSREFATDLAQKAVDKTDQAISATKHAVSDTAASVRDGLDQLQETSHSAMSYAAHQAEDMANKGMQQARRAGTVIRDTAQETGDRTVAYIRDEPIKAVLIAAAAGALISMLLSSRNSSR